MSAPPLPAAILGPSGPVAAHLDEMLRQSSGGVGAAGYEPRPEQVRMAEAVARTLDDRLTLLVEAGTGVGKSFAYLVPAILRALLHRERVVVATATISLQEQLISKDIPLLSASLERWGLSQPGSADVPALVPVLAKGRGNYVSLRRLELASRRQDSLLDQEQRHSLHIIEDWASSTLDGSLSTLPALDRPEVWDHARSDTDNCMGRKCPNYKACFYQNARRALEGANLIICNHALFFSDLALRSRAGGEGGGAILPAYDHVILDEAHNIEDAACEHFGLSLAQARVMRLLRTLYQPRKGKGYLLEQSLAVGDLEAIERACQLCETAERASQQFFDDLLGWAERRAAEDPPSGSSPRRGPPGRPGFSGGGGGGGGGGIGGRVRRAGVVENALSPALRDLAIRLRSIRDTIESEADRFELNSYARRAADIAETAETLIDQTLDGYVYWVDVEGGGARSARFGPRVTIACAPIEIAPILRHALFQPPPVASGADDPHQPPFDGPPPVDLGDIAEREFGDAPPPDEQPPPSSPSPRSEQRPPRKSVVLTSATLATRTVREAEHPEHAEAAFAHIMTNLGISDAATLQLGSPFDYARQAKVIIDLSMPNPGAGSGAGAGSVSRGGADEHAPTSYNDALAARVLHHVRATRGGAFVLFTSFGTLYAVADRLRSTLEREDMPVFVQNRDGSRQQILQMFSQSDHAVLFGAASFWQGVDVRGERLRNVIITRLPFEPPDRPLTQARLERIEDAGGNPFMQDSLPRAVIRFKQGFGRLIRSRTDTGRVVVLDPRIRTARYGKLFLDALPEGVRIEEIRPAAFDTE